MLWQQDSHDHVGDEVGPFDYHHMNQAVIFFNMPLQYASMSGIGMSFEPLNLLVNSFGRFYEVLFVVRDARQGTIIQHQYLQI